MQDEIVVNNQPPQRSEALEAYREGYQLAVAYSKSAFTPEGFRGKPENILVAMSITAKTGVSVFEVMNNMFISKRGKVGFESKFMISMANRFGPFRTLIDWEVEKKEGDIVVTAFAELASTGKKRDAAISLKQVQKAGWHRNSSGDKAVWTAQTVQMLKYKAAGMLVKLYCPEVLFGMKTDVDCQFMEQEKSGTGNSAIDEMNEKLEDRENEKL